jgi:hypothetical protein
MVGQSDFPINMLPPPAATIPSHASSLRKADGQDRMQFDSIAGGAPLLM